MRWLRNLPRFGKSGSLLDGLLLAFAFTLPLSIALGQLFAYAALLAWFAGLLRRRDLRWMRSPLFAGFALFALTAILVSVFGPRPEICIRKLHRLLLYFLPFAIAAVPPRPGESRAGPAARYALAFALGAAALAAYDTVRIPLVGCLAKPLPGMDRTFWFFHQGDMRSPQFFLCALCVLLAAGQTPEVRRGRAVRAVLLAILAAALVLHFKRGAWLSFGGAALILAVSLRRFRPLIVALAMAVVLALLPAGQARLRALAREWTGDVRGGRHELWRRAVPALLERHPWGLGYGGMTNRDLSRHVPRVEPKLNHLHNNLLQILVEMGPFGAGVWLGWMIAALALLANARRRLAAAGHPQAWLAAGVLAAFCGLLLQGLVEYNFGTGLIRMLFCLWLGAALVLHAAARDRSGAEGPA